jgi:FkbH-like protein
MARMAVGPQAQKPLACILTRAAAAVLRPSAKCIVLDLDNTIWGGVIGDDGPSGIKLGDDYPGIVFKDFQSALLGYRRQGFLLAIASKNDETAVRDVLDTHPEMILRTKHFAAIQVNWEPKVVNLQRIAKTLNIGLDSLVFIDDNPVERAYVRAELPMIRIVELPQDPLGYLPVLRDVVELDRPRQLREDTLRAEMYQQETQRKEFSVKQADINDFLVSLEMVVEVGTLNTHTIERIHQLIQKTNQFNLTTRRYSLEEIKQLGEAEDSKVTWLRLRDRFGELGLVCVGVIRRIKKELWEIDTFLMSCRVMGRNVEDAFLHYLAELAMAKEATRLQGTYIKTKKNEPVVNFYKEHGFAETGHPEDMTWVYTIELTPKTFAWPNHIRRVDTDIKENANA